MQIASAAAPTVSSNTQVGKLAQRQTPSQSATPIVSIENLDTPEAKARTDAKLKANLELFFKATSTPMKMGKDASDMAKALVSTMQSMVINRPDLATRHFDFKLDNGAIKVVSDQLSSRDKAWLEGQLNGNRALTDAATRYHDHAVEGYGLWAQLNGQQVPPEQQTTLSRDADRLTNFLELFQRVGTNAKKFASNANDGTYYASNGARISFDYDTKTAIGFLAFAQSAQAMADGSATWVSPWGEVKYGTVRNDPFMHTQAIPRFAPPGPNTLGFSQYA